MASDFRSGALGGVPYWSSNSRPQGSVNFVNSCVKNISRKGAKDAMHYVLCFVSKKLHTEAQNDTEFCSAVILFIPYNRVDKL